MLGQDPAYELESPAHWEVIPGLMLTLRTEAWVAPIALDAGVDIIEVKESLGHRYVTTTQIHDKRRRSSNAGASHDVPI